MKIHFIGDSHASIFRGDEEVISTWPEKSDNLIKEFAPYRIGAATAYNLEHTYFNVISEIIDKNVKIDEDIIFFCFGEIDCRAHLIKQSELQSRPIEDVVIECVNRYFNFLKHYKNNGYRIGVWGPIASWSEKKPYTTGPSFGTTKERNYATKIFNETIKKLCENNEILFKTIFFDIIDSELNTDETYLDDTKGCHVHLGNKSLPLVLEKFKSLINNDKKKNN